MELENKLTELAGAFSEFKKQNDLRLKEIETKGTASAEREGKVAELNETISKLEGEIKAVQTAMNRSAQDGKNQNPADEAQKKHAEALGKYLRKGVETPELKAMSVGSDEDGGFLVTPQMSSEIVKKVFESSPMRQIASVMTISTDSLEILHDLGEVGSGWVGETQSRPTTSTPQFKKESIPVHEIYAQPAATQKMLDDAAINIEEWLNGKIAEKFARDEASAFVAGNGVAKPRGFLAYDAGTSFGQVEQVESASSGTIVGDDLINLEAALKGAYKNGSVFLAQRETIKVFRKLKDSQGRYLWEPGLNGGQAPTLLSKPIMEAADMQAYSAGNLSVAFGDFKQGYQIVDRIGIRVIRDVYTAKPYVLFYTTKRVGGAVKNFEAIKILKVKA